LIVFNKGILINSTLNDTLTFVLSLVRERRISDSRFFVDMAVSLLGNDSLVSVIYYLIFLIVKI